MSSAPPEPHVWHLDDLRRAARAGGIALWSWNVDNDSFEMDDAAFALWGLDLGQVVTFDRLSAHIHPADRDRVRAAYSATRAIVGAYDIDFRIMVGDEIRWISARGQGDDAGIKGRLMFGIFLDVSARKQAEEGHELLAGEMSHRVKNLLAIASSLTTISSRSTITSGEMAIELTQRLAALGRAHDLVRPVAGNNGKAALLGDLLSVLLAPYDNDSAGNDRIGVAVQRMGVGEAAATTLALVVHELATNAIKYGALSVASGTLDVASLADGNDIVLKWIERGGPEVAPPDTQGFGSRLVHRSVSGQLGGSIDYDWARAGLIVTLRMNTDRLAA